MILECTLGLKCLSIFMSACKLSSLPQVQNPLVWPIFTVDNVKYFEWVKIYVQNICSVLFISDKLSSIFLLLARVYIIFLKL